MTTQNDDQPSKYGNVSKSWQKTFETLDDIGASGKPLYRSPEFKSLSLWNRARIGWNFKAFLFGPFYYLFKGMWQKGLLIISAAAITDGIYLNLFPDQSVFSNNSNLVVIFFAALCATLANQDYYLHKTRNIKTWKYLPDFLTHPASVLIIFLGSVIFYTFYTPDIPLFPDLP